jgi:hypothetical protein
MKDNCRKTMHMGMTDRGFTAFAIILKTVSSEKMLYTMCILCIPITLIETFS